VGVAENQCHHGKYLKPFFLCCEPAANGRRCPKSDLAAPVPSTRIFFAGLGKGFSLLCGVRALQNMMKWKASPGDGKALMALWLRHPLPKRQLVGTRPTGEKKGTKRHLLVDGRGVPLSLVVTGANRHDVTQLELVLDEIIIDRPDPENVEQHLCADKGYAGKPALEAIVARNYIAHVRQRGEEIAEKKANPGYRARRWVVEVSHSWFNRFRKILVRYEKLTESYLALLHMAAAIIAFRKAGVIYG